MLIDNVLLKEIPCAWYFRPYCFPEVRSVGEFENFSCFAGFFFVVVVFRFFFFLFFRLFFFFVFCCCFFFVPRGKSSVSSLRCFCCFFFPFLKFLVGMSSLFWMFIIHVFGVHQCGV